VGWYEDFTRAKGGDTEGDDEYGADNADDEEGDEIDVYEVDGDELRSLEGEADRGLLDSFVIVLVGDDCERMEGRYDDVMCSWWARISFSQMARSQSRTRRSSRSM